MELNIIEHSSSLKITLQNIKQRLTLKPSIFSLDKNIRAWINREGWGFVTCKILFQFESSSPFYKTVLFIES